MKQSWLLRFRKSPPHTQTNIVCTALIMIATISYAIIAGFQLIAINGQLAVMKGTLAEAKETGEKSTEQMRSAIGNINWEARSMDLSQKVAQRSVDASVNALEQEQRPWVASSKLHAIHAGSRWARFQKVVLLKTILNICRGRLPSGT